MGALRNASRPGGHPFTVDLAVGRVPGDGMECHASSGSDLGSCSLSCHAATAMIASHDALDEPLTPDELDQWVPGFWPVLTVIAASA